MKTVDSVDGEIRLTAEWAGRRRYIFISAEIVAHDAGASLSRAEAVAYVRANLGRYTDEARAQLGPDDPLQTIELIRG